MQWSLKVPEMRSNGADEGTKCLQLNSMFLNGGLRSLAGSSTLSAIQLVSLDLSTARSSESVRFQVAMGAEVQGVMASAAVQKMQQRVGALSALCSQASCLMINASKLDSSRQSA